MLHIKNIDEGLNLFKALGSEIRIEIVKLLLINKEMNMNEIATSLNLTNGAVTSHIKKMEECGLIKIDSDSDGHGNQKMCSMNLDKILIDIEIPQVESKTYETSVRVGQYSTYDVSPTCGLATESHIIGEFDDPRYFSHPERFDSEILWFTNGYIEYPIPNLLPFNQKVDSLSFMLELSSEAPSTNNEWPSDIGFYINDKFIGQWTSPGDFGDVKGIFTPSWWPFSLNQYGLLKNITINYNGTFVDGKKVSDVNILDLNLDYKSDIRFKLAVLDQEHKAGGITIYGKHFGNYNQDISVKIEYSDIESSDEIPAK